jgi:hypothetical protein
VFATSRQQDASQDSLILFYDDLSAPATGKAKIRFVHLAKGIGNVQVTLRSAKGDSTLYNAVPFGSAGNGNIKGSAYELGPYASIDAGAISLLVTPAGSIKPLDIQQQALSNLQLNAGGIYTVFIRNIPGESSAVGASVITHK